MSITRPTRDAGLLARSIRTHASMGELKNRFAPRPTTASTMSERTILSRISCSSLRKRMPCGSRMAAQRPCLGSMEQTMCCSQMRSAAVLSVRVPQMLRLYGSEANYSALQFLSEKGGLASTQSKVRSLPAERKAGLRSVSPCAMRKSRAPCR